MLVMSNKTNFEHTKPEYKAFKSWRGTTKQAGCIYKIIIYLKFTANLIFMQNHFVRYGVIMGIVSIMFSIVIYFASPQFLLTWGSWAGLVITIYFMIKSINDTKRDNAGFLTLAESFKAGWLTYVLGSVISSVFMYMMVNFIDPALIDIIRDTQIEALEKVGQAFNLSESQLEEQISVIKDTNPYGLAQIALAIPVSFLFPGAVISIIMAAILKKNNPKVDLKS